MWGDDAEYEAHTEAITASAWLDLLAQLKADGYTLGEALSEARSQGLNITDELFTDLWNEA